MIEAFATYIENPKAMLFAAVSGLTMVAVGLAAPEELSWPILAIGVPLSAAASLMLVIALSKKITSLASACTERYREARKKAKEGKAIKKKFQQLGANLDCDSQD